MIAHACHTKMMVATSAQSAMSAIALSILCPSVSKSANAQPDCRLMTMSIEFSARLNQKGRNLRQGVCETHPCRRCGITTQNLRRSGPWKFELKCCVALIWNPID